MAAMIPDDALSLFDAVNYASVATLMPDGTAQVTPVWIDRDGQTPTFNTSRGRVKADNLERDPRVTVTVFDQENPYNYVQVQGRAELVDEGADDHIDALAGKYLGKDEYPFRQEGERRVIVRVSPDNVDFQAA
jgi:PPOX class probable F420-dependent enzyme